jgi:uncharacterized MAPEG superfamily protein
MMQSVAIWCLLGGGLLPVAVVLIAKSDPKLDIYNPRDVHQSQTGILKRAYGAHLNGLEAYPLFAVAVLSAMQRGVPEFWLNVAAAGWLGVRIAYTIVYLADYAKIRAPLWALSVLISSAIFLIPG